MALDGEGAREHVVSSDRDHRLDSQFFQRRYRVVQHLPVMRDVGSRSPQDRAAVQVDARHFIDRKFMLLIGVTLGQPFETVMKPDRRAAQPDRLQRDGGDDAVDPGRRTTSDQNTQSLNSHNQWFVGSGEWGVGNGGQEISSPTPHSPLPTPYCFYANLLLNSSTLKFPARASFSAHSGFSKSL